MITVMKRRAAKRREQARQDLIHELFDRVNAAEPCPNPDCLAFRDEIRALSCRENGCCT